MNDTKPFWQSKTLIGLVTVLLSQLLGKYLGTSADLNQETSDLVTQVFTALGSIMVIVGRFTATKSLSVTPPKTLPMLFVSGALAACLLGGCASFQIGSLPVRQAAAITTGAALQFAEKDPVKRTTLANEIYGAAKAVYSLCDGTVPDVATLQATILSFGGTQTDANYARFATSLSGLYASYFAQVKGDGKQAVLLLQELAGGCEDAASAYVSASPTTPAPASN